MSLSKLYSLIVLLFIVRAYAGSILNELGQLGASYEVIFDHIEQCEKRGKYNFLSNLKHGKLNRTHFVYSGTMDTSTDLDDRAKVHVIAALKTNNGRYSTIIDVKMNACDMTRLFILDIVTSIFENCNQTADYIPFKCPMKRFRCDMKDYVINMRFNHVPAVPYGDYRVEINILKMLPYAIEERLSCTRFFGTTRPNQQALATNKKGL